MSVAEIESTRTTLAFAICEEYSIETDSKYTSYDAWEAIEDELHVTLDKVRHKLYRALITKKTGRSLQDRVPATDNLEKIDNWLNSFSIDELEAFRNDVKADLILEKKIRDEEDTARKQLIDLYTRVINGDDVTVNNCVEFFVSKRQKRFIKRAINQDIMATRNYINADSFMHIKNRHGIGGKADCTMASPERAGDIVDVLLHCDKASLSVLPNGKNYTAGGSHNKYGRAALQVEFTKKMKDGKITVVIEAMSDTKKGILRISSAYRHH